MHILKVHTCLRKIVNLYHLKIHITLCTQKSKSAKFQENKSPETNIAGIKFIRLPLFFVMVGLTLRSRWTTPIWWQWSTASRICWMQWLHANTRGPWVSDKLPLGCPCELAGFDTREGAAAAGHVVRGHIHGHVVSQPTPTLQPPTPTLNASLQIIQKP